jgi:hypothetical protein
MLSKATYRCNGVPAELTTSVVIGTDCIGSCKSNYHAITTTAAPHFLFKIRAVRNNLFMIYGLNICSWKENEEPLWSWSHGSWIYNYLCNQCLSPLMLWVRISIRARCTTLYDKDSLWLATSRWIIFETEAYMLQNNFQCLRSTLKIFKWHINIHPLCRGICENVFHFFTLACISPPNSFGIFLLYLYT